MPATKKTTKKTTKSQEVKTNTNDASFAANHAVHGFAVIETGGKQYRVSEGDTINIEKIKGEYKEGDNLIFDKVLLVDNGSDVTNIGTPYVNGAKVSATLVQIGRAPKVTVIKYKQKSRYFKKNGHRQPFFKVKIEKIT